MRVIAGDFKGRKLTAPKGVDLRPTADRVKEAIFSMVQPELPGAVCLDLFAGTGSLGIEALSRGAERAYFCDNEPVSHAALRQNLDACRLDGRRAVVIKSDWRAAYKHVREKCNLVFIDSPYEMCVYYSQILETLAMQGVPGEGAYVVIERDSGADGYEVPKGYRLLRRKRYGSVGVDLLEYAEIGDT
jgi:16S rRNA (guanine966-N2)-methyltransferase